ncbi:MAG: DUF58 domain-containing protein [Bryobacterales bacterium]|nr:DUF58 domain-containing protein [Bryobacterales bacterium]
MFKPWPWLRSAFDHGARYQVTRLGLLFTLTCVLVSLAAFVSANNLLFLILALLLATWMVSGFIGRLSLAGLELDFLLPEHLCARRKLMGRIVIGNAKRWMPSFSIHVAGSSDSGLSHPLYFPVIPGGERIEAPVELLFARRGAYRQNTFRFSTRFPFGFAERRIHVRLLRDIVVYPSIDPQPGFEELLMSLQGEIASFYRGQGNDFYRIRPYEALESAHHVDWKATAHTGDLQVREFAREQEQAVAFFLDLDVPRAQDAWFESAVDRCAFLAWNISQRGSRIRFCTQDVDWQLPEEADVYTILRYLAIVSTRQGRRLTPSQDDNVFQIVFSAFPERLARAGWELDGSNIRLVGPEPVGMDRVVRTRPGTTSTFEATNLQ